MDILTEHTELIKSIDILLEEIATEEKSGRLKTPDDIDAGFLK